MRSMPDGGANSRTRTRERTEVDVETKTIEETEHRCRNCNQWFVEDNLVPFGLGTSEDGEEAEEYDWLCKGCSDQLFDYTPGDTVSFNEALAMVDQWSGRDFASAVISFAIGVGIILAGVSGVLWALGGVIDAFTATLDTLMITAQSEEPVSESIDVIGYITVAVALAAGWFVLTGTNRSFRGRDRL